MVKYRASTSPVRHRSQPRASTDVTRWIYSRTSYKIMEYRSDITDIPGTWYVIYDIIYGEYHMMFMWYITWCITYLEYIISHSDTSKNACDMDMTKNIPGYQLLWRSHVFWEGMYRYHIPPSFLPIPGSTFTCSKWPVSHKNSMFSQGAQEFAAFPQKIGRFHKMAYNIVCNK